ncbi:MAG: AMP-binding protein [Eubacterium sp.]|nr:AMP-binding protein [Eubacterium sp.]
MYFFDRLQSFGARTALLQDDGNRVTYEQLSEYASWVGSIIPARSLAFCLCESVIGSVASYLSCLHNRIVPLLLDAGTNEDLLADLISRYQPGWVFLPSELRERYPDWETAGEKWGYTLLKTNFQEAPELFEDLGLLLTTSGSTGSPKLVRQSYQNIQSNAESIVEYLEIDENERPVTTLPMNYTYGLSVINSHMQAGACILLTRESVISKAFWSFMKENGATSIAGVPYTYEMLKRIRFFRMDLPALKTMTQAGGKLLPELHREYAEYAEANGKHFVVMYGQTEATARMGYLPYAKALEKTGSMGIPIPGGRFELIDASGNATDEVDVVGELVYEGPNVTLGYAEAREDLAKGDERGGRLETGDMAKRDADGYYYIVGRKKRFLKLFGNRVNLDEVERMIRLEFPDVDCACSGDDNALKVYVTDARFGSGIERFLITRTHINQRAIRIIQIDEIPRNDSGKIVYKELS